MSFTKTELNNFRTDFNKAVKDLEKQYGVEIGIGNISYSSNQFSSKLKVVKTTAADGSKTSAQEVEFNNLCFRFGLNKGDYKKQFTFNGSTFELTGFKPRSPKFPIIATQISNGQSYKLPRRAIDSI